ncbi:hypothetical protein DERP_006129 [Dermatophagoides pteronyssinus]|uniref:Profilin n=1 Tax=Dermatophagoides pteronyssinus TaxID=6956 RepID=A0ABQ8JSV4_DERPT|nr:hypothetical protein DERP_006129 [Dermatophagoides pteronyssinus]
MSEKKVGGFNEILRFINSSNNVDDNGGGGLFIDDDKYILTGFKAEFTAANLIKTIGNQQIPSVATINAQRLAILRSCCCVVPIAKFLIKNECTTFNSCIIIRPIITKQFPIIAIIATIQTAIRNITLSNKCCTLLIPSPLGVQTRTFKA